MEIYIRPLEEKDALVSYKWRNDPDIWKFTGRKPDKCITPEIELMWIREVLNRKNEKRYAICIIDTNEYIGNIQLTSITKTNAEFHIFIGEKKYWGKKIATNATKQIIKLAFNILKLKEIYLYVNKKNVAAIKSYRNCGFYIVDDKKSEYKMVKNE